MKFSYNWIKEYVDVHKSAKEAAELLTMHSFEVEEVLQNLPAQAGDDDYIFDIDILPNRIPDAASHVGVARELAVLTDNTFSPPEPTITEDADSRVEEKAQVEVRKTALCRRYSSRVIEDVRVEESPAWLQERLRAVGLQPINNIVDAANYVMLELGQPLHAFDLDKLQGQKIIVRTAKKEEELTTLDNETLTLSPDDLVIADAKDPVAVAGIKGGKDSGVTKNTKRVLLESANFDGPSVRTTAQRLKLHTDASKRFSAGLSPALTIPALQRLTALIIELAGGRVATGVLDAYNQKKKQPTITFSLSALYALIGKEIQKQEVRRILEGLDFKVTFENDKASVTPPAQRTDVERKEDVFEEVARIVGYEQITPQPFYTHLSKVAQNEDRTFRSKVRETASALGFSEVRSYSFVDKQAGELEKIKAEGVPPSAARWEMQNPASSTYQYLRRSLVPGIIEVVQNNQRFASTLRLFEVGRVYWKNKDTAPKEQYSVAFAQSEKTPASAHDTFYALKGRVETFLQKIGIEEIWFDEDTTGEKVPAVFNPAKSAGIYTENNTLLGRIGEVHPHIQNSKNLEGRTVLALFSLPVLQEEALADTFYQDIPRYPVLTRDIAFLVPREVRIADIENVIYTAGGEHLSDVDLFDIYENVEEEGLKSVAFHLLFQSAEKTLTNEDVAQDEENIKKALESKLNAQIR